MEKVIIDGIERRVLYRHERNVKDGKVMSKGGCTYCSVNLGTRNDPIIVRSLARCHSKDVYNKELGRRVSYGRLVQKLRDTRLFAIE